MTAALPPQATPLKHAFSVRAREVRVGDRLYRGEVVELRPVPERARGFVSFAVKGPRDAIVTDTMPGDDWVSLTAMVDAAERGAPSWCAR